MKVLLITVGSRGDAEPFCALAAELVQQADNSVEFFCQPELQELIPKSDRINVHTLPFTQFDFYKYAANPTKGQDHENPRVKFVGVVTEIICSLVFPCLDQVWDAAQGCDVLVTSALARSLCFGITQALQIPTVLLHLQPLVPTQRFPHYSDVDDSVKAIMENESGTTLNPDHLETYRVLEKFQHEFLEEGLESLYSGLREKSAASKPSSGDKSLATISFEETWTILTGHHPLVHLVNAFSEELFPSLDDVGPKVHQQVGPLADHYVPKEFVPNPELETFLSKHNEADGQRPICVGFGSMPYNQVSVVLRVLQKENLAAVLVGKALDLTPPENSEENPEDINCREWAKQHVIQTDSAPYAWLLPQCSMMLSHGGAGVMHATLRAGIPAVIAPFMGDQFAHAELLPKKGLGARGGQSLAAATEDDFLQAIASARSCSGNAQAFGERARSKPVGAQVLVALLQTEIVVDK